MSLILEALRRSEAERRRGAPPSLLGDPSPAPRPASSPWPIALGSLALGVALAAAAVAWWGVIPASVAIDDAPLAATSTPAPEPRVEPVPAAAYAPPPVVSTPAPPAPVARPAPPPTAREATPPGPVDVAPVVPTPPASPETGLGPRDGDLRGSEVDGVGMPPLRLSMHVYADDPSRRFAIIDGQRRREGETLQPGLVLLEIRRDGLRLGWQDRTLWMPR